jgi:hypothetical protein
MSKIYFLVDGFNLYHALASADRLKRYKWLSLTRLCQCFLTKADSISGIEYWLFTDLNAVLEVQL